MAEQFVCVRIQSMNGVNINQFQFEYDLTWMSFFQNAAGHTYTRYGGREDHDAESHLTKASLLRAMGQVLELHKANKVQSASRYEPIARSVRTPEDIPPMKRMLASRKESKCIHCHDVKVAQLRDLRDRGQLRKDMVFTYPSPGKVGIQVDRDAQNVVRNVAPKSPAAVAGIRKGDVIQSADEHRILTFADFTRVLELTPRQSSLKIKINRDGRIVGTSLRLSGGWRKDRDVSWRASLEGVGPSAGFWGAKANDQQRRRLNLGKNDLAMRVTFIWASWTRQAGIRNGDVVVAIDGEKADMNIRQLHAHLQLNKDWGDIVPLMIRRNGKELKLTMRLPTSPPE